MYRNFMKTFD